MAATDPKQPLAKRAAIRQITRQTMQRSTYRSAFSITEIVFGLILAAIGAYSLLLNLECRPDAIECVGWGLLGAAIFLIPGVLFVAAGTLSYFCKIASLASIQLVFIVILITYYVWGFAFP